MSFPCLRSPSEWYGPHDSAPALVARQQLWEPESSAKLNPLSGEDATICA